VSTAVGGLRRVSAFAQTYPETEIIVIDDGATDGSRGVIESFADRVRCVVEPHLGGGAARNRGLELGARRVRPVSRCR